MKAFSYEDISLSIKIRKSSSHYIIMEHISGKVQLMNTSNILSVLILLISIFSILAWCDLSIGNTTFWWSTQAGILVCLYKFKPKRYHIWQINLFLSYLVISAIYGAIFQTENYWDWKLLTGNILIFSLPLASYTFCRPSLLAQILYCWFKYAPFIFIIFIPFLQSDAYGRFLVPYSLLTLFFPLLNKKYKIIVIMAYAITITLGIDSRSDVIKFTVCLFLGISLLLLPQFYNKCKKVINTIYFILLVSPMLFFSLGAMNVFNIFNLGEELKLNNKYTIKTSHGNEMSALVDTRTFIYTEEIHSAIKNNYLIWGRSIARGYESLSFGEGIDEILNLNRGERGSSEVSILNIFNYFGIIGVIIYFLVFYGASYKAIYQSKNIYVRIIGIYVAFRWLFSWIEDFSKFDLNYLFLWIMIGICYSPLFRSMKNKDFNNWIKYIIK